MLKKKWIRGHRGKACTNVSLSHQFLGIKLHLLFSRTRSWGLSGCGQHWGGTIFNPLRKSECDQNGLDISFILSRQYAFINVEIFQVPKDNQTIMDPIAIIWWKSSLSTASFQRSTAQSVDLCNNKLPFSFNQVKSTRVLWHLLSPTPARCAVWWCRPMSIGSCFYKHICETMKS